MVDKPSWRNSGFRMHASFALVLLIMAVGFGLALDQHWRRGGAVVGAALLTAAVLRACLSSERVGLLAVRSRCVDVLWYAGLGLFIVGVAIAIAH